ncbi:MAG: DNA topoisomerase 3 [Prevotellaceae bacterium]|nr:DNA topoisomerase 3 [Prevotellaceae bacterium]
MIVCIAEKPSVARDIAEVLGARERRDGYMEGNGYQVTWTYGHLCTLKAPHEYTPTWKSWNMGTLPMIPPRFGIKLIENPTYERQFHIIEQLMQAADAIVNCGDAGQEGELIQRWVMQKAGARCPVKRLWISSLTEESIREGFSKLRDAADFYPLYEAGLSRAIGDWLLGMNATRLYTLKYGQQGQVLSVGRVQTPTLALIVGRQLEIDRFTPRRYWELKTLYRDTLFNAVVRKSDEELAREAEERQEKAAGAKAASAKAPSAASATTAGRTGSVAKPAAQSGDNPGIEPITTFAQGEKLLQQVEAAPFIITSVTKREGKEAPPRLFDLTSLQVECNRKYAYSADDTLKTIQSLYEKKITTYPRVDTTFLSDDIYPKCPAILRGLADYAALTAPLLAAPLTKSKKVFDNAKVTDHHAIIPTGRAPQGLTDMERRVFDMVARRFIAAFYPDCRYATTTVTGTAASVLFKATGRQVLQPGWRVVFNQPASATASTSTVGASAASASTASQDREEADKDGARTDGTDRLLPTFRRGEQGAHEPSLVEKWTQPPRPYTEATLLRAMETAGKLVDNEELRDALKENGIGRPSTRAAIIETLFKRGYIRKEKKNLVATSTGIELVGLIREELLKSAELTGIWEKKLRGIEHRTYDAARFLEELKQMVREVVEAVQRDNSNRRVSVQPAAGESKGSSGKTVKSKADGKVSGSAKTSADKGAGAHAGASTAASVNAVDPIVGTPCPLCGKGVLIKGKSAYGCSEWKNGCSYRKPFGKP